MRTVLGAAQLLKIYCRPNKPKTIFPVRLRKLDLVGSITALRAPLSLRPLFDLHTTLNGPSICASQWIRPMLKCTHRRVHRGKHELTSRS